MYKLGYENTDRELEIEEFDEIVNRMNMNAVLYDDSVEKIVERTSNSLLEKITMREILKRDEVIMNRAKHYSQKDD